MKMFRRQFLVALKQYCNVFTLLIFSCLSLVYVLIMNHGIETWRVPRPSSFFGSQFGAKPSVTIATVACGSRYEEALTMIKSALIFGKSVNLKFIIFVDSSSEKLVGGSLELLKLKFGGKEFYSFEYELKHLEFPPGSEAYWKRLYPPCASQKLFYSNVLPNVDSLIHIDSNTILLSNVKDFWSFSEKMSKGLHIAAMAPEHEIATEGWYKTHSKVPFYGKRGLNSGVILMNLTRMREVEFVSTIQNIPARYAHKIQLGDQDIFNIYFYTYPGRVLEIGCEYNYRPEHCECEYPGNCSCNKAEEGGVHIIHGNQRTFHSIQFVSFKTIYDTFTSFDLRLENTRDLVKELHYKLKNLPMGTPCNHINDNEQLLKHFWKYL